MTEHSNDLKSRLVRGFERDGGADVLTGSPSLNWFRHACNRGCRSQGWRWSTL